MQTYKRTTPRFFIIFLLLFFVFAAAFFAKTHIKKAPASETSAFFVLEIREIDAALLSHLHEGDRVVDRKNRRILGDITEIRSSQSTAEVYSEVHGRLVEAPIPDKLRVLLTLQGTARDGEILTKSGDTVRLGQTYYFRTYDFIGAGRVVALI